MPLHQPYADGRRSGINAALRGQGHGQEVVLFFHNVCRLKHSPRAWTGKTFGVLAFASQRGQRTLTWSRGLVLSARVITCFTPFQPEIWALASRNFEKCLEREPPRVVAQTAESAVSPTASRPRLGCERSAGRSLDARRLAARDTADSAVCATRFMERKFLFVKLHAGNATPRLHGVNRQ